MKPWVVALLLLTSACASTPPAVTHRAGSAASAPAPAEGSLDEGDLASVIADIASRTGENVLVAPEVHERVATGRCVPLKDSIALYAKIAGLEAVTLPEGTILLDYPHRIFARDPHASSVNVTPRGAYVVVSDEGFLDEVDPKDPETSWEAVRRRLPEGTISLDVAGAPFPEVIASVARQVDVPIEVDPSVTAPVTLHVVEAPWRDVLQILVRVGHVRSRHEGARLVLTPARPRPQGSYRLEAKSAPARGFFELLGAALGKRATVRGAVAKIVDASAGGTSLDEALEVLALATGYDVSVTAGEIVVEAPAKRLESLETVEPRLQRPLGDDLPAVALEGVVTERASGEAWALISGRVYRVGDPLLDATGKPCAPPLRVIEIGASSATIEVAPLGALRGHRILEVR
jgi:hypothetical protein